MGENCRCGKIENIMLWNVFSYLGGNLMVSEAKDRDNSDEGSGKEIERKKIAKMLMRLKQETTRLNALMEKVSKKEAQVDALLKELKNQKDSMTMREQELKQKEETLEEQKKMLKHDLLKFRNA
jgi:K+/H+ antiporter YhaU regulatory subunit KhtT